MTDYLYSVDGVQIAYHHSPGEGVGVMFLGGYRSDMNGTKALALESYCKAKNVPFTRFDYRGHGESGGDFLQSTLTNWRDDALLVLDQVTKGSQILVGSSMGGHIMLLAALARKQRIAGLVGIASAPDFTEKLMWERADAARQQELKEKGVVYLPSDYSDEPYAITYKLIEDGRHHLLLNDDTPIDLDVPVALLHGVMDEDVPWEFSMMLAAHLMSEEVDIVIRKDADHRFSRDEDIALLLETLAKMLNRVQSS